MHVEVRVNLACPSSGAIHVVFEMLSHWDLELTITLHWLASASGILSSLSRGCDSKHATMPSFLGGSWSSCVYGLGKALCQTRFSLQPQPDTLSTHQLSMVMMDRN